jgi:hypothetical protein
MKFKQMAVCLFAMATIFSMLSGCVSVNVTKAASISEKTICIVDNPGSEFAFRGAYERQIRAKGYATKIVKDRNDCPVSTTYKATYGMHWGVYLASAELKLFDQGAEVGSAVYEAPYASPEKHGRIEAKIEALLAKMLP